MNLPSDFRYERFAPAGPLANYIEHFWLVGATVGPIERREILVPNGRPTIIVNLADPGTRYDPLTGESVTNVSGITGIATRPFVIGQSGRSGLIAAQLAPFGLKALGCPALIDAHQPLSAWIGADAARALETKIAEAGLNASGMAIFHDWLGQKLNPLPPGALDRLNQAMAHMQGEDGDTDMARLAAKLGVGHDRFARQFRQHVGITPKAMSAILRYQRLVGGLLAGPPQDGLAQLALMEGYYDQAHANREFRRFTGVSPTRFRAALNGIAKMMHQG